jgi:hypothetical protein
MTNVHIHFHIYSFVKNKLKLDILVLTFLFVLQITNNLLSMAVCYVFLLQATAVLMK